MGFGDEIMTTGFARVVKKKYPDSQIVIGSKIKKIIFESEIFRNNPNITSIKDLKPKAKKIWLEIYKDNRPYILNSNKEKIFWDYTFRTIKGDLFFDNGEKKFAQNTISKIKNEWNLSNKNKYKKIVYIETSRISKTKENSRLGFYNRDWGYENWKNFIKKYKKNILFLQSSHKDSKNIDGIFSFESNFREACSVMMHCDLFVGWEGGFAHAAAALNKMALVLFGGWIDPKITGYDFHSNIYINIEGSPCGMHDNCDHCKKCIKLITPKLVYSKFEEII